MLLADVIPNAPTTTDDALALLDASAATEPEFTWHVARCRDADRPPAGRHAGGQRMVGKAVRRRRNRASIALPHRQRPGNVGRQPDPGLLQSWRRDEDSGVEARKHVGIVNLASPILGTR